MAYTKTVWENGITPISADNLNNIEDALDKVANTKGALVCLTSGINIPHDTDIAVTFNSDSVEYDTCSFFNTSQRDRITIPAGVSKVIVGVFMDFDQNVNVGSARTQIIKNGGGYSGFSEINGAGLIRAGVKTPVLMVNEGDYFQMFVRQESGATRQLRGFPNKAGTHIFIQVVE